MDTAPGQQKRAPAPAPSPSPSPAPAPAPAPAVSLEVQGAPDLPYEGTYTQVTVGFVSGTPVRVDMSRDGNPVFASWPSGSFFTLSSDGRSLTGNWCISSICWGNVSGSHVLNVVATYADGSTASASVTVNAIDSSIPVTTAYVQHVELVAGDARTGDRGEGWGGHQPRHTMHSNGTERLLYVRGDLVGAGRSWRLMKRAAGSTSWVQEAAGQTDSEAALIRDPATDTAHVIAYPGGEPTVLSAPSFAPVKIRAGEWPMQGSPYAGVGIGKDGTLVVKNFYDYVTGGVLTKDTDVVYASGRWNGSAWTFNPVVRTYIGERYCYDYILPGAFGSEGFAGVSTRDVSKTVAGLPNLSSGWVWDGVRSYKSGTTSASWMSFDVMPKRTQPSTTTTSAASMAVQDVFADTHGRLFTLHRVSDPAGTSGLYLTVQDGSGNRLYQGMPSYQGWNARVFEDGKGRLWLLSMQPSSSTPTVRLYPITSNYTLGTYTDLSASFAGFPYEQTGRIGVTRGGNVIGNSVAGYHPYYSQIIAWKIRLPD